MLFQPAGVYVSHFTGAISVSLDKRTYQTRPNCVSMPRTRTLLDGFDRIFLPRFIETLN